MIRIELFTNISGDDGPLPVHSSRNTHGGRVASSFVSGSALEDY